MAKSWMYVLYPPSESILYLDNRWTVGQSHMYCHYVDKRMVFHIIVSSSRTKLQAPWRMQILDWNFSREEKSPDLSRLSGISDKCFKPWRFPYQAQMAFQVVKDFKKGCRQKKVQPYKVPTRWCQGRCPTLVQVSHASFTRMVLPSHGSPSTICIRGGIYMGRKSSWSTRGCSLLGPTALLGFKPVRSFLTPSSTISKGSIWGTIGETSFMDCLLSCSRDSREGSEKTDLNWSF